MEPSVLRACRFLRHRNRRILGSRAGVSGGDSVAKRRGAMVGLFQLNIVGGILLAYGSNFIVARFVAGPEAWRYKIAVAGAARHVFFGLLFTIPKALVASR